MNEKVWLKIRLSTRGDYPGSFTLASICHSSMRTGTHTLHKIRTTYMRMYVSK